MDVWWTMIFSPRKLLGCLQVATASIASLNKPIFSFDIPKRLRLRVYVFWRKLLKHASISVKTASALPGR